MLFYVASRPSYYVALQQTVTVVCWSVLLVLRMFVLIQVKWTSAAVLQSLGRQCTYFSPHTHTHTHIQPPAARVNTDAQKPLQLLSTVLNAECTFHKHSFLRRVNMSVKRFLGHPVFIIECEGCYSRVWRTSQSRSPGDTNIYQQNPVQERQPDTYSLAKLNAWYRGMCNINLQTILGPTSTKQRQMKTAVVRNVTPPCLVEICQYFERICCDLEKNLSCSSKTSENFYQSTRPHTP